MMNSEILQSCKRLVGDTYTSQAVETRHSTETKFRVLLEQCKLPQDGWEEAEIELFIAELAAMDSNNFSGNCGAGEREARILSDIVKRRHFRLGHGIGRSGDLTAVQPKAAGSSVIMKLTNSLVLDCIKIAGAPRTKACFVVPMATGMTLTLCFLTLRSRRPHAKYIIWPRIDQKSCFKSIGTSGFEAVVVENRLEGDELRTDVDAVRAKVEELGAENVLAVMSTTSCFAPRTPDRLEDIGSICNEFDIPHVVNNAYGIQSSKCMAAIQQVSAPGRRLDLFVQSTDKNFLVPVGGAIVAGFDPQLVEAVSKTYPGRASGSPSLDLLLTLLDLGASGFRRLLEQRKRVYKKLHEQLSACAQKHGERVLDTGHNNISIAVTLEAVCGQEAGDCTQLGSMLFRRLVSGTRVVARGASNTINGHEFVGWGAHSESYPRAYLTAAAAVGASPEEVELFVSRLDKVFAELAKRKAKQQGASVQCSLQKPEA